MILRIFIILFGLMAGEAAHARDRDRGLYFGGGLTRAIATMKAGSQEAGFGGWGAIGLIGIDLPVRTIPMFAEGEYGRVDLLNTLQSTSYMERASNTFLGLKVGAIFGPVSMGGGVQHNQIEVTSVEGGTGTQASHQGMTYFGFAQLSFNGTEAFRTVFEAKYGVGPIAGTDSSETQLSLRFVFLPF
ncbi:MAG: hypothetical protein RBT63_06320 [Bdellovibrionales bacterium]|jgi:hypothetical protein|nr:hypothetical protein [Bdellovibrionales bacterium]